MTIQVATDDEDFHGLPHESVSALNASGKCVTDGETSLLELTAENIEMLRRINPKDARLGFMPTAVVIDPEYITKEKSA